MLRFFPLPPFFLFILEDTPDMKKDGGWKTILSVTLKKEHVKTL